MEPTFALMAGSAVAFWGSALYLALRFVRATERRGVSQAEVEELRVRMNRMEEELTAAAAEVERLAAGEKFTTQLLAERAGTARPLTIAEPDRR
jgi:hypothetical protein